MARGGGGGGGGGYTMLEQSKHRPQRDVDVYQVLIRCLGQI